MPLPLILTTVEGIDSLKIPLIQYPLAFNRANPARIQPEGWTTQLATRFGQAGSGTVSASSKRSRYSARSISITPRLARCGVCH
jgi:hypothetical protein